jgi:hypothetical protein
MGGILRLSWQRGQRAAIRRSPSALALALTLAGGLAVACTTIAPDMSEMSVELTGPFPESYRELVQLWIRDEFRDVSTVTSLQVSVPTPGYAQRWSSSKRLTGWYTRVSFKAKDSIGASKGRLAYSILLHDDTVISYRKLLY